MGEFRNEIGYILDGLWGRTETIDIPNCLVSQCSHHVSLASEGMHTVLCIQLIANVVPVTGVAGEGGSGHKMDFLTNHSGGDHASIFYSQIKSFLTFY